MQEPIPQRTNRFYEFEPFRFYLTERELYQGTERVALPPKALDTLALLLSRHGHLVDKDELMKVVWPDTFVEESNLVFQISQLRKTLGEGFNGKSYIETVPRRGYRFAAVVTESWDAEPSAVAFDIVDANQPPSKLSRRYLLPSAAVALFTIAALLLTGSRESPTEYVLPPFRRFTVKPPVPVANALRYRTTTISPNGRYIAFVGAAPKTLWIHDLEQEKSRSVIGAEPVRNPFWSPDSTFVGFASRGEIQKVSVQGGLPVRICSVPDGDYIRGAWSPDLDSVVFSAGRPGKIYEVPARGGDPTLLISPAEFEGLLDDQAPGLHWPQFLPSNTGNRTLLFQVSNSGEGILALQDLATGRREVLIKGTRPFFSPSGHIVYQPSWFTNEVWALPFSLDSLKATGEAFRVSQNSRGPTVADDQTLVNLKIAQSVRQQLVWLDRRGAPMGEVGQPQENILFPTLSPDEMHVALSSQQNSSRNIWIWDIARGVRTNLGGSLTSAWSPTGNELAFTSGTDEQAFDIFIRRADASGDAERLAAGSGNGFLNDWSADGKYLMYERGDSAHTKDLWYLERDESSNNWQPHAFLETPSNELAAHFSPDGRFVAYVSYETGRSEVYVRPFPEGEGRITISSNGGRQPRWSRNNQELFYVERDTLVAVPVSTSPGLSLAPPKHLFAHPAFHSGSRYPQYDVSADGERFIVAAPLEEAAVEIQVVQNWYEEFRDRDRN